MKILITTIPFGELEPGTLGILRDENIDFLLNPIGRKMRQDELIPYAEGCEAIIAGTDRFTREILESLKSLKFISRVGVGLDSIDLEACKDLGIKVSYTPTAPIKAVAELTVGLMFSLLRSIHISDNEVKSGQWFKRMGKRIVDSNIGIVGYGRIGRDIVEMLLGLGVKNILINDLPDIELPNDPRLHFASKEEILKGSDILSLHLPMTLENRNFLSKEELMKMKKDAYLINTSRGGIINEEDLLHVLEKGHLGGVALDVFENEPYSGPLCNIERCLLTPHLGPMTKDCRQLMERQASEEIVRFFKGQPLNNQVNL